MTTFFVEQGAHRWHVNQWGRGPHLIVAWHGFRQNGRAFAKIGMHLPEGYSLCAPDLPFHGKTDWQAPDYQPEDLWALTATLMHRFEANMFTLAGFSLGAQLSVGMALIRPQSIREIWLIAPDTPLTKWGWFTYHVPHSWRCSLQRIFSRPGRLLHWADRLYRLRLIDRFTLTFLHRNMANSADRQQLFGTWRARATFPFSFRQLRRVPIPVTVYLGRRDPLVPYRRISRRLRADISVKILDIGHEIPAHFFFPSLH